MIERVRKIRLIMELRQAGISDTRVLSALERVPREKFVDEVLDQQAYDNTALPIAKGQTISQPYVVAFMTQSLDVGPKMKVLEIGTGSGYQAAVLSHLAKWVYTIERHDDLRREAEARFKELRLTNIITKTGDGTLGWPEQGPFQRVMVTAAAADVPAILADQLTEDGIMIVPVGDSSDAQDIVRVQRTADGFETKYLLPVRFVPLVPGTAEDS